MIVQFVASHVAQTVGLGQRLAAKISLLIRAENVPIRRVDNAIGIKITAGKWHASVPRIENKSVDNLITRNVLERQIFRRITDPWASGAEIHRSVVGQRRTDRVL